MSPVSSRSRGSRGSRAVVLVPASAAHSTAHSTAHSALQVLAVAVVLACALLAPAPADAVGAMKITATADSYLRAYYNGGEVTLTDPTKAPGYPYGTGVCRDNAGTAACEAVNTNSGNVPNSYRMCAACPYTATIASASYGDRFSFIATYVPFASRPNYGQAGYTSPSLYYQPQAAAFNAQLQWAFNGFAYNTDQTWWCWGSSLGAPPAGWNTLGYNFASNANWRRCTQFGSIPSDNWGYGSSITFEISATADRPNWIWTSDGNNNAPSNPTVYAVFVLPSALPTLSTVNGYALGNTYTGYVNNFEYTVHITVGQSVTTLNLRATLQDLTMQVAWNAVAFSLGTQDVALPLAPIGSPNTFSIRSLSNDGVTALTYTVYVVRLPNAFIKTSHWQAENSAIDNYCTGVSDGVAQGALTYLTPGFGGVGSAWQFDGSTAYVTVPYNALSKVTLWYWVGGDFQIQLNVRFNTIRTGATCTAGAFTNPWISSAEGTSSTNNRWVVGYCNGGIYVVYNTVKAGAGAESVVGPVAWAPALNTWYTVVVTRVDHIWTFQVNGLQIGSTIALAAVLPQPAAPLYFGRFVNTYFNGSLDNVQFYTFTWIHFAKVDGSMYVGAGFAAMVSSGLLGPGAYEYVERCDSFNFLGTGASVVMRYTMIGVAEPANVVDYFRPKDGVTMCTMLQNGNQHMWSNSASGPFTTPAYSLTGTDLGGSAAGVPSDGRGTLSFWGRSSQGGGCCSATYASGTKDKLPFILSARASVCPLISPCFNNGPCLNNGVCTLTGAAPTTAFTCNCDGTGYSGSVCQTLINNCAPNPCLNGGTCTNGFYTYTCACGGGAYGTRCENLPPSTLATLTVSGVSIGAFSSNVYAYVAQTTSAVTSVSVRGTTTDPQGKVQLGAFAEELSSSNKTFALTYGGVTFIPIVAKGSVSTTPATNYNITITMTLSTDANIGSVTCDGVGLIPADALFTYTVAPLTTSVSCIAITAVGTSRIWFPAQSPTRNTTGPTTLTPASGTTNVYALIVQSEFGFQFGGQQQPYTLHVVRPFSTEARLQSLQIWDNFGNVVLPLTNLPTPGGTTTVDVDHDVPYVTIVGVLIDTTATMRLQGVLLSSGVNSVPQTLNTPSYVQVLNTFTVSIKAQDGSTTQTYTISVRQTAIPQVTATSACVNVPVTTARTLLRDHTRSLYITVPSGQNYEWLHVSALSNVTSAPLSLYLRGNALPDLVARQFDVSTAPATGNYSHVTLSNINSNTYYLSYQIPSTAPSNILAVAQSFDICAYKATPLSVDTTLTAQTVNRNGYAVFSYRLTAGQIFGSAVLTLVTTNPAVPSQTPLLQVYAALNANGTTAQQDLNVARGALQTDTNPVTPSTTTPHQLNNGDYQASAKITTPSTGLRAVFWVFADPTASGAQASYAFNVKVVPPLPTVTSVSPTTSSKFGNVPITITGTNFEPLGSQLLLGIGSVIIGGTKNCTNPTYTNQRQILCIIPPGETGQDVDVQVKLYGRTSPISAAAKFKYDANCIVQNDTMGGTYCFQCQPGTYSTAALTTRCANCTIGTYTFGYGQSTCTECGPGTFASKIGSSFCTNCAPGSATDDTGAGSCPTCAAGSYAATDGLVTCPLCDAGSYSPRSNATACVLCAPGSVQPAPGLDACSLCAAGKSMPVSGAATCIPCTGGKFSNITGLPNCYDCPAGKYASGGSSECTACPKGSFAATSGQAQCQLCGPGTYGNALGMSTCLLCELGTASAGQGTQDTCPACANGWVAVTKGLVQCTACPPGSASFSAPPTTACARCPAGTYQPFPNQLDCLPCGAGTFFNTTGATKCDACPVGRFQTRQSMGFCDPCPVGFAQTLPGQTGCTACAPGKVQPATGQVVCTDCPAGYANDQYNATVCLPCDVGRSSTPGSAGCSDCDVGKYASQTASTECTPCDRGLFGNSSRATACFTCSPGYINIAGGSSSCFGCPVGQYQPSPAQTRCLACAGGFYNDKTNQTICQQCGPTTYSTPGSLGCTNCTVGHASTAFGVRDCPLCAEGSYQDVEGQLLCKSCGVGTASNLPGAVSCSGCQPGSFAGYEGMHTCASCPAGTAMPTGSATICKLCDAGRYQPGTGAESCLPCPQGTYTNVTGVLVCEACQPGTSNPNTGQIACQPCAPGYSTAATGAIGCAACPIGTYSPTEGTQRCQRCDPGTFNNETTMSACPQCAPGTYQDQDAQTMCLQCVAGKFSSYGAVGCDQCGDRFVAPNAGASTCYSCDPHAQATKGNTICSCNVGYAGKYELPSDGRNQTLTVCYECPRGAVCNEPGTLWDSMTTESGWWSPVSGVYYQCLVPTQCVGGGLSGQQNQCRAHYTGPMCAYCEDGYSQGVDGECNACSSSVNSEYYTAIVIIIFLGVVIGLLYVLVRSGDLLMDIAFAEEERLEREAAGFATHTNKEQADLLLSRNRHGNIITLRGPPAPYPDFTFKLKILLGFLQVVTNLSFGLSIQWPPTFSAFLNWFNPANLDFIKYSSVDCLSTWTYYDKVVLFVIAPPACFILLLLFYFIPLNIWITCCRNYTVGTARPAANTTADGSRASTSEGAAVPALDQQKAQSRDRKRSRRNFWKMFLFALFLLYPTLSATILRMYICVDVEGQSYLVADMRTVCHDDTWNRATYLGLPAIAVYPIGIPLFFIAMILRYRNRLEEAGVRAQLGFIYDAYEHRYFWFEMADMVYKLAVTSAVAFLPNNAQLQAAMGVVYVYLALILVCRPFLRKGDDALISFALIEIILLLLAGLTFDSMDGYSHTYDVLMSIVLIMVFGLFVLYFLITAGEVLRKLVRNSEWGKKRGWKSTLDTGKTHKSQRKRGIEGEMAARTIDRRTMLRASSGGGAASRRLQAEQLDGANVLHTRNPLFDVQSPRNSVAVSGAAILSGDSAMSPRQSAILAGQFSFGKLPDAAPQSPTSANSPASPRDGAQGMEMTPLVYDAAPQPAAVAPVPAPAAVEAAPSAAAQVEGAAPAEPVAAAVAPAEAAPIVLAEVQPVVLLPVDAGAAPVADASAVAPVPDASVVAAVPPAFAGSYEPIALAPEPVTGADAAAVPAAAAVEPAAAPAPAAAEPSDAAAPAPDQQL